MKLPAAGLVSLVALREAAAGSYQDLMHRIEIALRAKINIEIGRDVWASVVALFNDHVVVRGIGDATNLTKYTYTVAADGKVTFGTGTPVEEAYNPAGTAAPASRGHFLEAIAADDTSPAGSKYLICVIKAGESGNRNIYPARVLREAAPMFEGVRVFVKSDAEHLRGEGKAFDRLIGKLSSPRFVEGKKSDEGEIQAEFHLIEPESDIGVKLREAYARSMTDLFGFSIDADGAAKPITRGGVRFQEATKFTKVRSVDLIVEAGAGGSVIRLIEAQGTDPGADNTAQEAEEMKLRETMIKFIESKKPELLKGVDATKLTDDEVMARYTEALQGEQPAAVGGTGEGNQDQAVQAVRLVEARIYARDTINASTLPKAAKDKLLKQYQGETVGFTEAPVQAAITAERDYLAQFTESGTVRGLGEGIRVEAGESLAEKVADRLDAFFDPAHKDHRNAQSFREAYVDITGDKRVTGMIENCDEARFREALGGATLANVLGAALRRRMLADYRLPGQYDIWRRICNVVPVNDFRTNERTRWGGYGDMPAVTESAPYVALASPGDEKAEYAVTKRGGLESISLEKIRNDDVGVIRQVPIKLSRASKRTLSKFVFDFIRTNPVVYDGVTLFHASKGNLGTAALAGPALAARRLAMLQQTELGSNEPLGIGPRSLLVPATLEETGADLFRRNTNQDKTFTQSLSLDILPVWYWTDANDWALAADPLDIPGMEVGFLDGNEEPEIFVQDSPTQGSMFSNDNLTWKLRHIFGGAITDRRAFDKSVVA